MIAHAAKIEPKVDAEAVTFDSGLRPHPFASPLCLQAYKRVRSSRLPAKPFLFDPKDNGTLRATDAN
jgi:hypothetical protein